MSAVHAAEHDVEGPDHRDDVGDALRGRVDVAHALGHLAEDGGEGTDFHAVMQGYVSVTPLLFDRTFSDAFSGLDGWLEGLR